MESTRESIAKWLEEFRARDKERTTSVEVELSDEEQASILKAATSLGMTFDEYCNYALEIAMFSKICPTCRQYRQSRDQICNICGEVD
jgi:hypothetical protein